MSARRLDRSDGVRPEVTRDGYSWLVVALSAVMQPHRIISGLTKDTVI